MSVYESDGGRLAVGEFDGEAKAECGAGKMELVGSDLVEEASSVAENDGNARNRIPNDIAKAAQTGERGADLVPVGMKSRVFGSSDREEALGGGGDRPGIGDVELEGRAWGKRLRQRDGSLMKLAGVVGVGVEGGDGKGHIAAADTNPLP